MPFQSKHSSGYRACYRAAVAGTAAKAICASRLCLAEGAAGAFRECSLLCTSRWIRRLSISAGFTPPILHACPTSLGWICAIQRNLSAFCFLALLKRDFSAWPAQERSPLVCVEQMHAQLGAFDHTAMR